MFDVAATTISYSGTTSEKLPFRPGSSRPGRLRGFVCEQQRQLQRNDHKGEVRATARSLQSQPASDDVSLNFRSAGVDGRADRIPQGAFQLVFHHEAIAAVDLHSI